MKCKGCKWFTRFHGDTGVKSEHYCIGSPDHETPAEFVHLIDPKKVEYSPDGFSVYKVKETDECVLWFSDRFENKKVGA